MEELDVDLSFILGTYILPSPSAAGRLSESTRANRNLLRVQTFFVFYTFALGCPGSLYPSYGIKGKLGEFVHVCDVCKGICLG